MEREIVVTGDGSHTIRVPELNVTYHSLHGAVQESMHVFIEAGLSYLLTKPFTGQQLSVFEMGFGTGLNALLTAIKTGEEKVKIHYTAIENSPLGKEEETVLNYGDVLLQPHLFNRIHAAAWNEDVAVTEYFTLKKIKTDIIHFSTAERFNLIYYDAFAPSAQPELWTEDVFKKLYDMLQTNGVLATYCSKSDVRRAMVAAGFRVEKLPGPQGKREMVRAAHPDLPGGKAT